MFAPRREGALVIIGGYKNRVVMERSVPRGSAKIAMYHGRSRGRSSLDWSGRVYTGSCIVPGHNGWITVAWQSNVDTASCCWSCRVSSAKEARCLQKLANTAAVFDGRELERFLDYSIKAIDHRRPRVEPPPSLNSGGLRFRTLALSINSCTEWEDRFDGNLADNYFIIESRVSLYSHELNKRETVYRIIMILEEEG